MAGLAALINIWLGIRIGEIRRTEKISIGDGGNERLIARMRAQANFIENVPLVLILVVLIEMAVGGTIDGVAHSPTWLWVVATLFMLGRIGHALGMDGSFKQGRMVGTILSMLALLGLGIYAIALPFLNIEQPTEVQNIQASE
jgi:uncharacterized membrane protein YecN with MAPEG domain